MPLALRVCDVLRKATKKDPVSLASILEGLGRCGEDYGTYFIGKKVSRRTDPYTAPQRGQSPTAM